MKIYGEHTNKSSLIFFTKYKTIMFNLKVFVFKEIVLSSSKSLKKAVGEKAQIMYFSFSLT